MKSVNKKTRIQPACANCLEIEKIVNKIYKYYSSSNKRQNDLRKFCILNLYQKFRLVKIFEVRWVRSHYQALLVILRNYPALTGHLHYMKNLPNTSEFDQNTIDRAKELHFWLSSKHFLVTILTQLDIQLYFSIFSEEFQLKGDLQF